MKHSDTITPMLKLWRRHTPDCAYRAEGRDFLNCRCPIWVDGAIDGQRYRASLKTRDLQRAARRVGELERGERKPARRITEAVVSFLQSHTDLAASTRRKYSRVVRSLQEHASDRGATHVPDISIEMLDAFSAGRGVSSHTWSKELPIIRQFFSHCVDRGWIAENPAKRVRMPRDPRPRPVEPYTREDLVKIIAASTSIGRSAYERARAYAMTLLFRYTALRISDVAVLDRARVSRGEVFIRAEKNGKPVRLPVPRDLQAALDNLPAPRGAGGVESRYFFWSGNGSPESAIRDIRRTMKAVFRKAGVKGARPHTFRHTLAVEILVSGGTIEDVASILGDSPATIRKHYAPWTVARQERITSLMQTVYLAQNVAQSQQQARTC